MLVVGHKLAAVLWVESLFPVRHWQASGTLIKSYSRIRPCHPGRPFLALLRILFCPQDRPPLPDHRCGLGAHDGLALMPFWPAVQLAPTVTADSLHKSLDAINQSEGALVALQLHRMN